MGTANFMFNRRLDVISGSSVSHFDFNAFNAGLDEEDRLSPGDGDRLSDILARNVEDAVNDLKCRADKPENLRKHRISGFLIESDTAAVESCRYYDRNYGGIQLAEITAETLFFGRHIRMEMAVVQRHGYYDGCNLDQEFKLMTGFSYADFTPDDNSWDSAADFIIDEYRYYAKVSKAKTGRCYSGITKRLQALENALWLRYEELAAPHCERYRVGVRFDNGETWYERAASSAAGSLF